MAQFPAPTDIDTLLRDVEKAPHRDHDLLDIARHLGDFQFCILENASPAAVLAQCQRSVARFIPCLGSAFYFADATTGEFKPAAIPPAPRPSLLEEEEKHLMDSGIFALAMREERPITVHSRNSAHRIIVAPLATATRTHALFLGLLPHVRSAIPSVRLSLLNHVLCQAANALESLAHFQQQLAHEQSCRTFMENLSLPVFETDAGGTFTQHNDAAIRLFGPASGFGSTVLLDLAPPAERPQLAEAIGIVMQQGKPASIICRITTDGGQAEMTMHLTPVMVAGRSVGLRGILTPVVRPPCHPHDGCA